MRRASRMGRRQDGAGSLHRVQPLQKIEACACERIERRVAERYRALQVAYLGSRILSMLSCTPVYMDV